MILDFSEIPEDGLVLDRQLKLTESASGAPDPLVHGAVHLAGRVRPGSRGVELSARVEATLRLECSRCLESLEMPLETEFFLVVVSEATEFGVGEKRLDPDDAALFYADRGKVDLREIAREQIHLNLPLKTVCRPDCAGLCPTCGANRNRIKCPCSSEDIDPRLAPLRDIEIQKDEE